MKNRCFITGGTGFVGNALIDRLHKKVSFSCLVRDKKVAKKLSHLPVRLIEGDILDKASLIRATKGVNQIIHIAGITAHHVKAKSGKYEDNVLGMKNMIKACQENNIQRFVFISTNAVNYAKKSGYAQSKLRAEKILRQSNLQFTILRPALIYGPKSRDIEQLLQLIKGLPFTPIVGKGNNRCQPIYIGDIVAAVEACLEKPRTIKKTYTIGGRDTITTLELIISLQSLIGTKKKTICFPYGFCLFLTRLCETFLPGLGLTKERLESSIADIPIDNTKAYEDLEWKALSFKQGLAKIAKNW